MSSAPPNRTADHPGTPLKIAAIIGKQEQSAKAMLDRVIAWSRALQALTPPAPTHTES